MSHNSRPSSVNRVATNKECLEEKNDPEGDSNYTTVTYQADGKESITLSQKEKEDRIRQFREQQEEERQRRLYELQNATIQAQKHREQLEDERRKKIKELRIKEIERRQAVEERKRMIWEAEQERKEAILKRNLEREARIEARRNAQRNAMSYAFGSSTPRSFDLDLVALGSSRLASQGSIVLSASSSHQIDEKEHDSKKFLKSNCLDRKPEDNTYHAEEFIQDTIQTQATNSDSFAQLTNESEVKNRNFSDAISDDKDYITMSKINDLSLSLKKQCHPYSLGSLIGSGAVVGDDPMSRSMISLSSTSRARRKTDLMPVMPRDQIISRSRSPGNHGKRAVSMTRLDQLAQPRRRYVEASKESATGINSLIPVDGPRTTPPSMSKSMHNISNHFLSIHSNKQYPNNNSNALGSGMSKSMTHLAVHSQLASKSQSALSRPSRTNLASPTLTNKPPNQSMRQSAITTRATRTSRLRTEPLTSFSQKRQGSSVMNKTTGSDSERLLLSASTKDVPSRPRSSMSATSEQSVASSQASVTSVKMRTGPKRQRPVSIGGVPSVLLPNVDQQQNRKGRSIERKAITPNAKHIRAKSCEKTDENKSQTPVIRKPAASQKVSKVKQVAADTNVAQNNQTVQPEAEDLQKSENNKENTPETASSPLSHMKSRITSEEEAKAAIAEKRRIAREQAEREAELERQRLEKIRQEEEELRRKEEEEQKRFEEEQIKLAEIHRLQEEEKLRKAIEEQEQREKEERERQEEEMRLRIEKEEMERKAREEAEKQRLELEERLKKEEAERAERKRRVEQIMSRTRKIGAPSEAKETSQTNKLSSPEEEEEKPLPASSQETTVGDNLEVKSSDNSSAQSSIQSDIIDAFVPSNASLNGGIQEEFKNSNPFVEQSFSQGNYLFNGEKTIDNNEKENHLNTSEFSMKESDSGVILTDNSPNRTTKLDAVSQPNGYNHQDEDKSFTDSISPEEKSEVSVDVLLDFGTIPSSSELQSTAPNSIPTTEFDQLIDISIDTSTRAKQILYINQMK
ncbi:MAP7 domain-containing protein 1-like isoform X2 [Centruroides vittatus]|uniref:MAP7 domain-containing protein 1-like isoform X2 n=1 Tax=Centruroides vittatus TaxID=120091 RepID=UPI00350F8C24